MLIPLFNFLKGLNSQISAFLHGLDGLAALSGGNISRKLGAILKDVGYYREGAQLQDGKSILGLYDFHQNSTTQKLLATVDDATSDDTQLFYKIPAGSWIEVTAAETAWANVAGAKVEMVGFIDRAFIVGHSAVDGFLPIATFTGTTFSTADANLTSMPQGKFIVDYKDCLYVLNVRYGSANYPYRAVKSTIVTAGAITWPTDLTNIIDFDFGHEITGAMEAFDKLFVWTEYDTWYWDNSEKRRIWAYGCSAHRTIQRKGSYLFWADGEAVYLSTGGQPIPISGPIEDYIKGASNPRDFFATIVDEEYILYVGTVEVDGISYSNCEVIFNIATSTWRVRENGSPLTAYAKYNVSGSFRRLMGDNDGNVWHKSKYSDATIYGADEVIVGSSAGKDISAFIELPPLHMDAPSVAKDTKQIVVYALRAQGVRVRMRRIDSNTRILNEYQTIGELTKYINTFEVDCKKGELIQLSFAETSKNPYFSILGVEFDVQRSSNTLKKPR